MREERPEELRSRKLKAPCEPENQRRHRRPDPVDSGGPQNTISAGGGFTLTKGKHTFKWGGNVANLRDNHTFGAFETANGVINTPQNLLNGAIDTFFAVAIDPHGHVPGDRYNPATDGAFSVFAHQTVPEGELPRSYLERVYNIQRWTVFPRGGHFAPAEEPAAIAGDLTAFFRDLS